ncbi:hypothetical protein A3731_43635 [Roseovarius sp. HI0049]|nr:hypothetical protein A3731_43635 [Roseovarius sp. HI0049]
MTIWGQGAIDDPQHVFPGHIRAQAAHMGHPILRGLVQALHVAVLSRQPHLAQRGGVFGAKPRIATNAPFGARRGEPGLCAFTDQSAFELDRSVQNMQRKLTLW